MKLPDVFTPLASSIKGDILHDELHRILYATDASVYRQKPRVVLRPDEDEDIVKTVQFCSQEKISITPRAGGTSLGGQVVSNGIILDFSKDWSRILEINKEEKWVRVLPGIIRDELNHSLKEHNLFFAPETSTTAHCMIGGMVGNNSCGSHSIIYGSTRDHLLEAKVILSDGTHAHFRALSQEEFNEKLTLDNREGDIYRYLHRTLSDKNNQSLIKKEFPKKTIHRRNTGYAIDLLLNTQPLGGKNPFNLCTILAGSEGTLGVITELKLNLVPLPPKEKCVVAVHLNSINDAMEANLVALKYKPSAVEIMDQKILECAQQNKEQLANSHFLKGTPAALLIVEFHGSSKEKISAITKNLQKELKQLSFSNHFPILWGDEVNCVWNLRKAGLGTLSNYKGDAKPIACIEDVAVDVKDQPAYIKDIQKILDRHKVACVYYGHIGDGEIHLRPVLNLKSGKDRKTFQELCLDVAKLVKRYQGSLSGEHGDGRVRAPFIEIMVGEEIVSIFKELKAVADPANIFNPGKIVNPEPQISNTRYSEDQEEEKFVTHFDFAETGGMLRMAEKCNGSGDCKKTIIAGGTMCPSYMVSRDEKDSTRGRANVLREYLTRSIPKNRFTHKEVYKVLDLCLSCKACKTECPSNVDMATLKAEYLQHYYDLNGISLQSWLLGNYAGLHRVLARNPFVTNLLIKNRLTGRLLKEVLGIARQRDLPLLSKKTLRHWIADNPSALWAKGDVKGSIHLFCDEFTNYHDAELGIKAIDLFTRLGYNVLITDHRESGRALISKGLVRKAKRIARKNVRILSETVNDKIPLVGLEPSALLVFRDEYPSLVGSVLKEKAVKLSKNAYLFDEWIANEFKKGKITAAQFTDKKRSIKWHGHCQQKALTDKKNGLIALSIPENYTVEEIPSGCCGMAGSFGLEKEHYDMSMRIGELTLFPEVRKHRAKNIIASSGMSCRHQIREGTRVKAQHPIELLHEVLKD